MTRSMEVSAEKEKSEEVPAATERTKDIPEKRKATGSRYACLRCSCPIVVCFPVVKNSVVLLRGDGKTGISTALSLPVGMPSPFLFCETADLPRFCQTAVMHICRMLGVILMPLLTGLATQDFFCFFEHSGPRPHSSTSLGDQFQTVCMIRPNTMANFTADCYLPDCSRSCQSILNSREQAESGAIRTEANRPKSKEIRCGAAVGEGIAESDGGQGRSQGSCGIRPTGSRDDRSFTRHSRRRWESPTRDGGITLTSRHLTEKLYWDGGAWRRGSTNGNKKL